jgi:phytoene desaturase
MAKSVIVIGSGFAGLSAASFMAKAGWQVTVLEKHEQAGGEQENYKPMVLRLIWTKLVLDARCF